MNRQEAWSLLVASLKQENLVKHCLATEAIMRALAKELGRDVESWGIAGLLHDLDFEATKDEPHRHTLRTAEILSEKGLTEEIIQAIKAHNAEALGLTRTGDMDYALSAAEALTGLIVTAALVLPDKKLSSLKPQSILRRMKEKAFARNVNREAILECEKMGLSLERFVELSLKAMQGISRELGL